MFPASDPFKTPELTVEPFDYGAPGLKPGTRIFSRCGSIFEFGEAIDKGRWLIYPTYEARTYDGDYDFYASDQPIIADPKHYYPHPPKQVVDRSTAEVDEKLKRLQQQVREEESKIRQFEIEEKARLARIARHEQLQRLDDYISGKITHLTIVSGSDIKVVEFSDAKCQSNKKEMRLLMLFGNSKGDLTWRISTYSDDSGGQHDCFPHFSYEDALAEVTRIIDADFETWRTASLSGACLVPPRAVKACAALHRDLPEDVVAAMRANAVSSAGKQVVTARNSLVKAMQEYANIVGKE